MQHTATIMAACLIWPAVLGMAGCGSEPSGTALAASSPEEIGSGSVDASLLVEGKAAYEMYCIGCHGVAGDGRGEAAGFLDPRPRNFQTAEFKFNSRGVGELPTDQDLKRTIRKGLRGTSMPAYPLLADQTLDGLIVYLKTFSPCWEVEMPGREIPRVEDPWRQDRDKSEAIKRGELVYHGFADCWSCHPAYVSPERIDAYRVMMQDEPRGVYREDLQRSVPAPDHEGNIVYPPDFKRDFVRSGTSLDDLYRSIGAGIQGSAMPMWLTSITYQPDEESPPLTTRADIWAMAYYIQDLIRQRPRRLKEGEFEVRERPSTIFADGLPEFMPATSEPYEVEPEEQTDWGEERDDDPGQWDADAPQIEGWEADQPTGLSTQEADSDHRGGNSSNAGSIGEAE